MLNAWGHARARWVLALSRLGHLRLAVAGAILSVVGGTWTATVRGDYLREPWWCGGAHTASAVVSLAPWIAPLVVVWVAGADRDVGMDQDLTLCGQLAAHRRRADVANALGAVFFLGVVGIVGGLVTGLADSARKRVTAEVAVSSCSVQVPWVNLPLAICSTALALELLVVTGWSAMRSILVATALMVWMTLARLGSGWVRTSALANPLLGLWNLTLPAGPRIEDTLVDLNGWAAIVTWVALGGLAAWITSRRRKSRRPQSDRP